MPLIQGCNGCGTYILHRIRTVDYQYISCTYFIAVCGGHKVGPYVKFTRTSVSEIVFILRKIKYVSIYLSIQCDEFDLIQLN